MSTITKLTKGCFAAIVAASMFSACLVERDRDRDRDDDGKTGSVDEYLTSLDQLEVADNQAKTEVDCADVCPTPGQEGDYYCTYHRYTETQRYDRFVAFQPNSATLWPGAVIHGYEAQFGHLNPLSAQLAPVRFSISLENINASPVGYMPEPSLSAFREERNNILGADVNGATAASIDFEIIQVHSESQAALALGAGVDWPGAAQVTGSFDFSSSEKRTKILVNFTQAYYTIDVDTPTHPGDFFDGSVSLSDIEAETSNQDPPLYVQSITFGRRVLFSVESAEDADSIMTALEAAVSQGVKVDGNITTSHQELLQQSTIRAFVIGGSGGSATGVVNGFQGLVDFIQQGGDYSKESPGAPIAYKLAYLTNASAQLAFTTEYDERDCTRNRANMRVELLGFDHLAGGDVGGNIEFYGNVTLRLPSETSQVNSCTSGGVQRKLWELLDGSWITMEEYGSWIPSSAVYLYEESVPVEQGQKICLSSHLWEEDYSTAELSGDDDFGTGELQMLAQEGWEGEHTIQVRGPGNNAVDIHLKIELQ